MDNARMRFCDSTTILGVSGDSLPLRHSFCHSASHAHVNAVGSSWAANHRGRFDPLVQDHEPDPVIATSVEKETRYRQSPSPGRLVLRM